MPLRKAIIYKYLKNVLQVVISRELDVPAATVNRIVSRFKCTGHTLAFWQGKCGRRRVLSLRDERLLSRASSKHSKPMPASYKIKSVDLWPKFPNEL